MPLVSSTENIRNIETLPLNDIRNTYELIYKQSLQFQLETLKDIVKIFIKYPLGPSPILG